MNKNGDCTGVGSRGNTSWIGLKKEDSTTSYDSHF